MTARTADSVAKELYDEPRDLLQFEQDFLTAVQRIGRMCTETIGIAARTTGPDSTVTLAIRHGAQQRRDERYAAALERYDAAVAAMDEDDEAEAVTFERVAA